MLIITNRNINHDNFTNGVGDHEAFGDGLNEKGPTEVRLARAEKNGAGAWKVELVEELKDLDQGNIPSRVEFGKLRDKMIAEKRNCVFFVHGFNQNFERSLEKSWRIQEYHGVEVIVFSWPSNPGGFMLKEYRQARRAAQVSAGALDAALEKLGDYLKEPFDEDPQAEHDVRFSLLTFSMGNFIFKNYVVDGVGEGETRVFENVIISQADIDNRKHKEWVDDIEAGKRVYITINENDRALKGSEANFKRDRLGRTVRDLNASNAMYIDFTDGENVGKTHCFFDKREYEGNAVVNKFFTEVLNGRSGESIQGLDYDARTNTFRLT